jgi:hypothetical protein
MKKIRVMLTAIGIMAVVGGALALKAKTYSQLFCTRRCVDGPGICQGSYIGRITPPGMGACYYTTPTNDGNRCTMAQCTISTYLTVVE